MLLPSSKHPVLQENINQYVIQTDHHYSSYISYTLTLHTFISSYMYIRNIVEDYPLHTTNLYHHTCMRKKLHIYIRVWIVIVVMATGLRYSSPGQRHVKQEARPLCGSVSAASLLSFSITTLSIVFVLVFFVFFLVFFLLLLGLVVRGAFFC